MITIIKKKDVTLSPVEVRRVKACPPCFESLSMTSYALVMLSDSEVSIDNYVRYRKCWVE